MALQWGKAVTPVIVGLPREVPRMQRCIPHELGHFVTQSIYEDHAEIAAWIIRKRALDSYSLRNR
jgi:hypothetical protein